MASPPPGRPWSTRLEHALAALAVGVLVAWVLLQARPGSYGYNIFSDRDFARALRWREALPVAGAEMIGPSGARVPGPALGLTFLAGSWLAEGPDGPFRLALLGLALSTAVVHGVLAPRLGPWAAAATAALWVTHPVVASVLGDLWNPSFLPLPLAVALAGLVLLVVDRRPAGLAVWAAGAVVAGQLHLGVLVWSLALLPALVLLRPAEVRAGLGAAGAVILVLYAPYLLVEGARGGGELRRLLDQVRFATSGGDPGPIGPSSFDLLGQGLLVGPVGAGAWAGTMGAALVGLGVASALRRRDPARDDLVLALALQLGLGLVLVLGVGSYAPNMRYFAGAAGAASLIAGAGLGRLVVRLPGGWVVRVLAAGAVAAIALTPRTAAWPTTWPRQGDPMSWATADAALDALTGRTGLDRAALARRTAWVVVRPEGGAAPWDAFPTLDHAAALRGEPWTGSGEPPCHLVYRWQGPPDARVVDAALVAELLDARVPIVAVDGPWPLSGPWSHLTYTPARGRCATTMGNRYVDTPAERDLREAAFDLPAGAAVRLPFSQGVRVGGVLAACAERSPDCARSWVAVDLLPRGERLGVVLHANQLRGIVDNGGWYEPRALAQPTVHLRSTAPGGASTDVLLDADVIGGRWIATPVEVEVDHPGAGPWQVSVSGRVTATSERDPARAHAGEVLTLDLGTIELP